MVEIHHARPEHEHGTTTSPQATRRVNSPFTTTITCSRRQARLSSTLDCFRSRDSSPIRPIAFTPFRMNCRLFGNYRVSLSPAKFLESEVPIAQSSLVVG